MNRFSIFAVLATSLGTSAVASASEIHVPGDYPTIQQAIEAAQAEDVIIVAPGLYLESIQLPCESITVRSSDGPDVTTIDASGLNASVVTCICEKWPDGTQIVLEGFTITGGTGTFEPDLSGGVFAGGGMYNKGASPEKGDGLEVTNCIFTENNGAEAGGGMFNSNSSPAVSDCTFSHNAPTRWGGGMYNFNNSNPTVTNCLFSENYANYGGGMYNHNSNPTAIACTFTKNSAPNGAGMYNAANSTPTIIDCMFVEHSAGNGKGAGMFNDASSPTVTGCTFTANNADQGGGMYSTGGSSPILSNCTFSANVASGNFGGGMSNDDSSPNVSECTFQGNRAPFGGGMFQDSRRRQPFSICSSGVVSDRRM